MVKKKKEYVTSEFFFNTTILIRPCSTVKHCIEFTKNKISILYHNKVLVMLILKRFICYGYH